jgi:hypothetical protein
MIKIFNSRRGVDNLDLRNGISIEVRPCSFRKLRGYTHIGVICDELATWYVDARFANPDTEVIAAVKPGLLTTGGPTENCITAACQVPYRIAENCSFTISFTKIHSIGVLGRSFETSSGFIIDRRDLGGPRSQRGARKISLEVFFRTDVIDVTPY